MRDGECGASGHSTPPAARSLALALADLLPDGDQRCAERLTYDLAAQSIIEQAHVIAGDGRAPQLCVHYDATRVGEGDVARRAQRAAATITTRYGHLRWSLDVTIPAKATRAAIAQLRAAPGVVAAESTSTAIVVEFERARVTAQELVDLVSEQVRSATESGTDQQGSEHAGDGHAHEGHQHGHGGIFGERSELVFAALSGVLLIAGWALASFADTPRPVELGVYALSLFFGAYYTVQEAYASVRYGKFEIDFLMLVSATGAAALGEVAEGALLLFLFSVGHALEGYAMGRARRSIEALAELAPKTALVRRGGTGDTVEIPVAALSVGDIVVVRPNMRVAADGFVVAGSSSIDQAPVTGESVPVDKSPVADIAAAAAAPELVDASARVFAGTINGVGAIEIQVTRLAADSTLARVVRLVAEAQTKTTSAQRFADRFQRLFVPTILAGVVLLLFAGLVIDEPFTATVYRALAVLVAASPCALAIATPSAVLSAVARAARAGILVKGGAALEELGRVQVLAFDKTGTLTQGKPQITDVIATSGTDDTELLAVAVAVEEQSDHPLARAIVRDGRARLSEVQLPQPANVRALTGRGVAATVNGREVRIGKRSLFEAAGQQIPSQLSADVDFLEQSGRTTMLVAAGDRWLGVIGLMDVPRVEAAAVLKRLKHIGVEETVMLSGDNQRVADAVAAQVGVAAARGDLMPEDKVAEVASLRVHRGRVGMVGDGVNDAPAMARANIGIAMGAAGSDVALETADIALMADDLTALPFAVDLSRRSSRIIKQNLWASLGIVAVLIPATVLGLGIGPAVLIHEGSTLIVVFNALRLLAMPMQALPTDDVAAR
ncbi:MULTISPECIES: heavy metal translocating P-type ATPase [Mycolicibacterium]|uniref:Heavy metal translocating P-type ATPase n=2 Tax=Mycolicibacterium TaxID=1866885 RepID=W9ARK0_MYCCO|nr:MULTISPECIES: heavy metal translocating P-type ATPase [Mycolicibacterium]CDO08093.1 heavy metal translocating P-type ATPase [Mycolicibacterium cosmeticum]